MRRVTSRESATYVVAYDGPAKMRAVYNWLPIITAEG